MKGFDWKHGLITVAAVIVGVLIYEKVIAPRFDTVVSA